MDVKAEREKLRALDYAAAHAAAYGSEQEHRNANMAAIKATSATAMAALDEVGRLQSRIAQLEQERRWVPVAERTPDCDCYVWGPGFGPRFAYAEEVDAADWDGRITHWMPMPQPPEGEKHD